MIQIVPPAGRRGQIRQELFGRDYRCMPQAAMSSLLRQWPDCSWDGRETIECFADRP
jgi:hypothetical protein